MAPMVFAVRAEAHRLDQRDADKRDRALAWRIVSLVGAWFGGKLPGFAEYVGIEVPAVQSPADMKSVLRAIKGGKAA